eukprot:NODE_189_length_15604_cov_0.314802.p4 type:complete len:176 gc:universal NODE_189_length_15604_cov_0.314802:799-1326(+)
MKQPKFTHFLSAKVILPQLENLNLPKETIIPYYRYHFTLALFSVPCRNSNDIISGIKRSLESVEMSSITVELLGYFSFQKKQFCKVLFCKPEPSLEMENLKLLIYRLLAKNDGGYRLEKNQKLHMTVAKSSKVFDARHLNFNTNCGSITIEELQFCKMGQINGKYQVLFSIRLAK